MYRKSPANWSAARRTTPPYEVGPSRSRTCSVKSCHMPAVSWAPAPTMSVVLPWKVPSTGFHSQVGEKIVQSDAGSALKSVTYRGSQSGALVVASEVDPPVIAVPVVPVGGPVVGAPSVLDNAEPLALGPPS